MYGVDLYGVGQGDGTDPAWHEVDRCGWLVKGTARGLHVQAGWAKTFVCHSSSSARARRKSDSR